MTEETEVDFNTVLQTVYKQDMQAEGRPITLGMVSINALLTQDAAIKPEESLKRHHLAQKIAAESPSTMPGEQRHNRIALSVKQRALLQDLIGKVYGPAVYGAAHALLEKNA